MSWVFTGNCPCLVRDLSLKIAFRDLWLSEEIPSINEPLLLISIPRQLYFWVDPKSFPVGELVGCQVFATGESHGVGLLMTLCKPPITVILQ